MSRMRFLLIALLGLPVYGQGLAGMVAADDTGAPVSSVSVRIFRIGKAQVVADLDTTAEGRFEAPGIPAGDYRLEIAKPNWVATSVRLAYAPGGPRLLIRLVRCGVITGQVLDPRRQPATAARVLAIPKPPGGGPLRPFSKYSAGQISQVDERGQFRLYQLPPGEYAVAATYGASTMAVGSSGSTNVSAVLGSGAIFYPQTLTITSGEEYPNVNFSILPGALSAVSGKLDAVSDGPGAYWLALTPADQPALAMAVTQAEKDGSFRLPGVAPGSYSLLVSGPAQARGGLGAILPDEPLFGRTPIVLSGQDMEGVRVALDKGGSLPLLYEASGEDCPPVAKLSLNGLEDWAAMLERTVSLAAGKTQLVSRLAPTRYAASLSELGANCYADSTVVDLTSPADSKPVIFRGRQAGSVRGRLTGTARPGGFTVLLSAGETNRQTVPDDSGRFQFSGLVPGRYRFAVQSLTDTRRDRWLPAGRFSIEVEVPGGAPTDLELPAPATEGDGTHD